MNLVIKVMLIIKSRIIMVLPVRMRDSYASIRCSEIRPRNARKRKIADARSIS